MLVNLWDNTFRHDVGSVAGKTPQRISYVRDLLDYEGTTLFVDGCAQPETVRSVKSGRKIGWLHEPRCLHPEPYNKVDWEALDLVLTYDSRLLQHPKSKLVPYGGIWLPREIWGIRPKSKLCSMLIGSKRATEGHRLRWKVAEAIGDLDTVDFYGAIGEDVGYGWQAKQRVLADYAFTVVVENCQTDNYFDEWLGDALVMGTVPIFWGMRNSNRWFNDDGFLTFDAPGEARRIVKGLSMELYAELGVEVMDNFRLVQKYEITDDLVAEALG